MEQSSPKWFSRMLTKLFSDTNTIPFMFGLFIGVMAFNSDIVYNAILTVMGGGLFHGIRLVGIGH